MKKWRNKITGEINEFMVHKRIEDSEDGNPVYAPFDGHIDDWEDYEEPKTFWAISWAGEPEEYDAKNAPQELKDMARSIGNYFETREEAEKAVKRLRAWKRLKDKGFRFNGVTPMEYFIRFTYNKPRQILDNQQRPKVAQQFNKDLDLLFSGEDD